MPEMIPAWVDGVLTPVEKLEVHQRGLRHKAVSVFINCDGWTLIQRRALEKYHTPGLWANACCTHPRWDEDSALCAARRLAEELNVTGLTPVHTGQISYRADVGNDLIEDEVVQVFVAETDQRFPVVPNPDEVMDTRWVSFEALEREVTAQPDLFTPWLSIYLAGHGDRVRGVAPA